MQCSPICIQIPGTHTQVRVVGQQRLAVAECSPSTTQLLLPTPSPRPTNSSSGRARWSAYGVVGLVLLLLAGLATAVVLVRRPFPQVEGSIRVLAGAVEVVRDDTASLSCTPTPPPT